MPDAHPEPPSIAGVRVLVVDDNPDALEVLALALDFTGAHVIRAISVDDAVQIDPAEFDVVITDLGMPQRSGYELLEVMRDRAPHIPVVAVTGFSTHPEPQQDTSSRFAMYLTKPVDHDELVRVIHRLVNDRGSNPPD
jgi:two-component system, chemotaxis family, CheB/CheR fusion protein